MDKMRWALIILVVLFLMFCANHAYSAVQYGFRVWLRSRFKSYLYQGGQYAVVPIHNASPAVKDPVTIAPEL